jgi:hypothetical protein
MTERVIPGGLLARMSVGLLVCFFLAKRRENNSLLGQRI